MRYTWQMMTPRERLATIAIVVAVVGAACVFFALGGSPLGPFTKMHPGSDWECPPNQKPSATVCHKKRPPAN